MHKCDGSLLAGLPLPSGRGLWRASNRADWETQYKVQRDKADTRLHMTCGDLMDSHRVTEGCLDQWLSQIDDFGSLVVAAASLPR
jgi:hypothetical protein